MVIILEGLDKTGKTTLARKLADMLHATYVKVSQPKTDNPFLEYVRLHERLRRNRNYVLDRSYLGQRAYGPVYRGEDLTDAEQLYLEMQLNSRGALMIYCKRSDPAKLVEDYATLNETFTRVDDLGVLARKFDNAVGRSILPTFKVVDFAEPSSLRAWITVGKLNTFTPHHRWYLGRWNAPVMLLGDRRDPAARRPWAKDTFCSPSGLFLMEALLHADLDLKDVMIVNVHDVSRRTLRDLVAEKKRVVCLGKEALDVVVAACPHAVNMHATVHPQYARRFGGPRETALTFYAANIMEVTHV